MQRKRARAPTLTETCRQLNPTVERLPRVHVGFCRSHCERSQTPNMLLLLDEEKIAKKKKNLAKLRTLALTLIVLIYSNSITVTHILAT